LFEASSLGSQHGFITNKPVYALNLSFNGRRLLLNNFVGVAKPFLHAQKLLGDNIIL
jgi:hypothetical protein